MEEYAQLGIGLTVAILILEKVFTFLSPILKLKNGNSDNKYLLKEIYNMISKEDDTGTPLIYKSKQIEQYNEKVIEALNNINNTNRDIVKKLENLYDALVEEKPRVRI